MSQDDKTSFITIDIKRPYFLSNPTKTWGNLIKHATDNSLHKKDSGHKTSHCRLDGGIYCYDTDPLLEEFFTLYSQDIEEGVKHYCHENRSEMFPLFFDLDLLLNQRVSEDKLLEWALLIHRGVRQFLKPTMKKKHDACFINAAPIVPKDEYFKAGLHIHYPEIIVDLKWAVEITAGVVKYVNDKIGKPAEFVHSWYPKVIDIQPLERGLRMIGSRKSEPCKECRKSKRGEKCNVLDCVRGHIDKGRPYWPRWLVSTEPQNAFMNAINDTLSLIKLCSTRIPVSRFFPISELPKRFLLRPRWWKQTTNLPEIIGNQKYNDLIRSNDSRKMTGTKRRRNISMPNNPRINSEDTSENGTVMHGLADDDDTSTFTKLQEDDPHFLTIRNFFEGEGLSTYKKKRTFHVLKDGCVTGVSVNKSRTMFFVWTSSRQCRNLVPNPNGTYREHSSRTIWIKVTPKGIQWQCHCKCETTENRVNGVPCLKPGIWARTNPDEYKQLKILPGELCSLFGSYSDVFAKVLKVSEMTKRGIMKSTVHERLLLLEPVVDNLKQQWEDVKRSRAEQNTFLSM